MGAFRATTTLTAAEDRLFDHLAQVRNLPRYFSRMASAQPGNGDEVQVQLDMIEHLVEEQHATSDRATRPVAHDAVRCRVGETP